MTPFAFIIHPIDAKRDVARKYPIARYLPESAIEFLLKRKSPMPVARIDGVRASSGAETCGWLVGCPLTPRQFLTLPLEFVYKRLEECGHIAEDLGAGILGLGAFTSVVGDGGITLAERLRIAVTTGNSYTVATAIDGAKLGAKQMGIDVAQSCVAIVGATGSIGATCAESLARDAARVVLVGRDKAKLAPIEERVRARGHADVSSATDVTDGLRDADIIITVSSAAEAIIGPEHIKRGAVVCDVARPRDVSVRVARERDDVLVIEGGVIRVPGAMRCRRMEDDEPFSFGFPPGTAYACMSETMALALSDRRESFTLGKDVSVEQSDEIRGICEHHGFGLSGFRSFEHAVTEDAILRIRERAGR